MCYSVLFSMTSSGLCGLTEIAFVYVLEVDNLVHMTCLVDEPLPRAVTSRRVRALCPEVGQVRNSSNLVLGRYSSLSRARYNTYDLQHRTFDIREEHRKGVVMSSKKTQVRPITQALPWSSHLLCSSFTANPTSWSRPDT